MTGKHITQKHSNLCHVNHQIITGDFGIILNKDLKQLLLKGPNCREETSISWEYNIKLILTATEDYAKIGQRKSSK